MDKKHLAALVSAAAALFLISCPQPLTRTHVDAARDTVPPVIAVSAPAEYASFSRIIVITGTVRDANSAGGAGSVRSLSYQILSHTAVKSATVGANGSFTIEEPNDLRENIVVLLTAVDWNGNVAEHRLPLTYPGNEIPSFAASEGNRQTTLTWDPVPGVSSYRLYMEASARTPDPASSLHIDGIVSPYQLTQLKNGTVYSLLLEGTTGDGRKNYSTTLRSMPLSTMHLFPSAASYFNGIEVSWRTVPAVPAYEVLRSDSPDGPWESVSGPVSAPPFRDASVSRGRTYYYSIRPASYSSIRSEWVEARADPAASRSDAAVSLFEGISAASSSAWRDGYLYVADSGYGLRVIDVRDPSFPREVGKVAISSADDVYLQGNYAYVTGYNRLHTVDISVPAAPAQTGSVVVSDSGGFQAEGVSVLGDLAFVAGFNAGLFVVDVSDKSAPVVRISELDAERLGQTYETAVQERGATRILAVAAFSGSSLYEIGGTAAAPTLTLRSSALGYASAFAFSGTVLYASSGWDVAAYQTSDPTAPVQLDSVMVTDAVAPTESVSVYGTRVFAPLRGYGYGVVDATNPSSLSVTRVQTVLGNPTHVEVGGGYAYVSAGSGYGMPIFGAADPSDAVLAATLTNADNGARLAAYRNQLFVAESGSGDWKLAVYDLSNPAAPARTSFDENLYTPYDFAFAGGRSYVAAERSGAMQWDVSDPGLPSVPAPGYFSIPGGDAWSIALSGHYAFIGTSKSYFVSVDVSRSNSLTVVSSVQTQGSVSADREIRGLSVKGSFVYAANEQAGLRVVDVSDPTFPIPLAGYGALPASGSAAAVAAAGDILLVADSANGLLAFDGATVRSWSSSGQAPIWPTTAEGPGATDVAVRGNYAYVAIPTQGLQIWDVSNPRAPVSAGTVSGAGFSPVRLVVYGDYLYALDGASKLYVVDLVP